MLTTCRQEADAQRHENTWPGCRQGRLLTSMECEAQQHYLMHILAHLNTCA